MRSITLNIINISIKIQRLIVLILASAIASIAFINLWFLGAPILYILYIAYCILSSKAKLTSDIEILRYDFKTQVVKLVKPISIKTCWDYSHTEGAKYPFLETAKVVAGQNVINVYIEIKGKLNSRIKFLDQIKYSSVFPNEIEYQKQNVDLDEYIPIHNYRKLLAFLDKDTES